MKQIITRDNRGNLVNWYGFEVSETSHDKSCFLDLFGSEFSNVALLHLDDGIIEIDFSDLVLENIDSKKVIHTENEICNYLYSECRKYEEGRPIYVNPLEVEDLPIAGRLEDFMTESELAVDSYFSERDYFDVFA